MLLCHTQVYIFPHLDPFFLHLQFHVLSFSYNQTLLQLTLNMASQDQNSGKSILVLGAGELGTAIITALTTHPLLAPNTITVLLRGDPSEPNLPKTLTSPTRRAQVTALESKGIAVIWCDIATSPLASLSELFAGYSTVIGASGMTYPPGTQLKLAQAVLNAHVELYLPWQYGIDYDVIGRGSAQELFAEQLDVRELLRAQRGTKTRWGVVSTGLFVSFLFEPEFGVVSESRDIVTALGGWENEITVTAPRDIGAVVAEVVLGDEVVRGVIYVAGETVSYETLARYVEGATGKQVRRVLVSKEQALNELREDPKDGIKKYRAVFAEGRGVAWPVSGTWSARKGMEMGDVRGYLRGGA